VIAKNDSKIKGLKTRKILLIFAGVIILFTSLTILFISPLVKYLVERDSKKYTGRKITMDWAYVNPFTGFVRFNNLRIYESKKDTLFFSAKSVTSDFNLIKLFSKTVEITELVVNKPRGTVINVRQHFNFDDMVLKCTPDNRSANKPSFHVNILAIKILHGEFYYIEKATPINYLIKDLNMESSGKRWNADTIASAFSFLSQNGKGGIKGNFTINVASQDYRFTSQVRNFDLEIIRQYLWELINYGFFSARLDATFRATGNFKNPELIDAHGRLAFSDFHLGKTKKDDYAAFEKLVVVIDHLNPKNQKFLFDSIILSRPVVKYEQFDSLDNVERLFGKAGANITDVTTRSGSFNLIIEIGRYLKSLTRNFFQSHYRINSFTVTHGDLKFNDFSLIEQFNIGVNSLSIHADSVDKNNSRIGVNIKSEIKPYGNLSISLSVNPKDSGDFDMSYHLNKIPASAFNPYLILYTSFPLDRGTIELNGVWNVRNGEIKSVNHLVVIDPRVSKRIKNKEMKWLPLPLIMLLVRERSNVIDYEIPISGNLKNPHFHLHDIIMDLLKNIFVKPVTIPYGISLRNAQSEIENSLTLKWNMRQTELSAKQKSFIKTMAEFLDENKTSTLNVYSTVYSLKEKEQILFFAAKKKYFLSTKRNNDFTKDDSIKVEMMSIKDPKFMHTLKKGSGAGDTLMFTIQDECYHYVGNSEVIHKYKEMMGRRDKVFQDFFVSNGTIERLKFHSDNTSVPYNGFSNYKIVYEGDVPHTLKRAYKAMHEFDSEGLRKRYGHDFKALVE